MSAASANLSENDSNQRKAAAEENVLHGVIVSGSGPAVICLHSTLNSAKQWQPLVKQLESNFKVIAIDLYNYGQAPTFIPSKENPYNLDAELARIAAIIEHYVGEDSFHLIGHSFGGAVSLKLAQQFAGRLLSLNLYEPVAFHFQLDQAEKKAAVDHLSAMLCGGDSELACQFFIDFCNGKGAYSALPASVQSKLVKGLDLVKLNHFALLEERYPLSVFKAFNCPKLLMYGKQSDELIIDLMHEIIASDGDITTVEFNAGHMAPLTHAKEVNQCIAKHLMPISGS